MQLKKSTRKYILCAMILFIILGLISTKVLAKKQDEDFLKEDFLFQQAGQLYSQGNYEKASEMIEELLLEKGNSESVNYLAGLIAANKGDFTRAAILLQKTMDINPHKVEDSMFMIQFGETLFYAERFDDAKIVLSRCQAVGWIPDSYPEYQNRVAELLAQIETK